MFWYRLSPWEEFRDFLWKFKLFHIVYVSYLGKSLSPLKGNLHSLEILDHAFHLGKKIVFFLIYIM